MRAGGRNRFAQRLFTPLPARYDRLAEILSMGQNGRWRREMVSRIAAHPARAAAAPAAAAAEAGRPPGGGSAPEPPLVLDVASGTAGVAIQLAARTGARVVGVDLTEAMLRLRPASATLAW